MTSLRVALKLSMANCKPDEVGKSSKKNTSTIESSIFEDSLIHGRKRKMSVDKTKSKEKEKDNPDKIMKMDDDVSENKSIEDSVKEDGDDGMKGDENSVTESVPMVSEFVEKDNQAFESSKMASEEDHSRAESPLEKIEQAEVIQEETEDVDEKEEVKEENDDNHVVETELEHENRDEDKDEINEDKEKEELEAIAKKKKKKIRSSSMLKGLGLTEPLESYVDAANDGAPRYGSHRQAAMVAKTKLNPKTAKTTTATEETEKSKEQITTATPREKKKEKAAAAVDPLNWVQCDRCAKWRSFFRNQADPDNLPDVWYCEMNTWNHRNTCDVPDETVEEAQAKLKTSQSSEDLAVGGDGGDADNEEGGIAYNNQQRESRGIGSSSIARKNKAGSNGRWKNKSDRSTTHDDDDEEGHDGDYTPNNDTKLRSSSNLADLGNNNATSSQRSNKKSSSGRGNIQSRSSHVSSNVSWVQCNKCRKWRKVSEYVDVDSLPEKWYCQYNTWALAYSRCSAKEEQDETPNTPADTIHLPNLNNNNNTNNRSRRQVGGVNNGTGTTVNANGVNIKEVKWVQCERRNCKKWRKVPAHVDMDTFPEKWYCEMNSWDPDRGSCDVPESSDEEGEQNNNADTRSQLILANSKGPSALSYRRIIFGTDGKIRVCFSEKNKNGYGIFSYSETKKAANEQDDYTEPTRRVSYWWSGVYDEKAANVIPQPKAKKASNANLQALASEAAAVTTTVTAATTIESKSKENDGNDDDEFQPSYLMDTIHRMYEKTQPITSSNHDHQLQLLHNLSSTKQQQQQSSASNTAVTRHHSLHPKMLAKIHNHLSNMTIFQRQQAECVAIRSCFLLSTNSTLTLQRIQQILQSSTFANADIESCRLFVSHDIPLKAAIKRLEDQGEVSVTINSTGLLTIELLKPLDSICPIVSRRVIETMDSSWTKQGLPLKLRKFHKEEPMHLVEPSSIMNNVKINTPTAGNNNTSNGASNNNKKSKNKNSASSSSLSENYKNAAEQQEVFKSKFKQNKRSSAQQSNANNARNATGNISNNNNNQRVSSNESLVNHEFEEKVKIEATEETEHNHVAAADDDDDNNIVEKEALVVEAGNDDNDHDNERMIEATE